MSPRTHHTQCTSASAMEMGRRRWKYKLLISFLRVHQPEYLHSDPSRRRSTHCVFKTSCVNRTPLQEVAQARRISMCPRQWPKDKSPTAAGSIIILLAKGKKNLSWTFLPWAWEFRMRRFLEFSGYDSYHIMTDHIILYSGRLPSLLLVFIPFPQQSPTEGLLFSPDF